MAFAVVMPRLGWNMEIGAVVSWRKADGEPVQAGEILLEIEADKAVQEVEALESGILRLPPDSPRLGEQVSVGTLLAYLLKPGEALPFQAGPSPQPAAIPPVPAPSPARVAAQPPSGREHPAISPRAARVAAELGVDWAKLKGSGRTGRIVERDVRAAVLAIPKAPLAGDAVLPISRLRPMAASAQARMPVTLTTEADATELLRLRSQLENDGAQIAPSCRDLLIKLASLALMEHPRLNARLEGEAVAPAATVNMGIVVDTERGELAPVVRDAQAKSLRQIAAESAAFVERARAGRLGPDDLCGGTFTIADLGSYEIDAFTPLIVRHECAILGIGRIVPKQIVVDAEAGRVAIRQMTFLSLTFDHRLADSASAARFLQRVKQYVEKPYLCLAA